MSASGLSSRRIRWIAVFALLLFVSTAIPVFAASPSEPSSGESQEAEESSVPLPKGEDVSEGLAEAEQQEKAHEEELATPAATQEREASGSAYTSADASESEQLLKEQFSEELAALNADPARFLSDATLDQPLGESGAKVTDDEGKTQLLESLVPYGNRANPFGALNVLHLTLVRGDF